MHPVSTSFALLLALCVCGCFGKTQEPDPTPHSRLLTPTPQLLWTLQWGTEGNDDLWAIETSPDGSVIIGGRSDGPISGSNGAGSFDVFVAKLDGSTGNRLWVSTSGTPEWDDSPDLAIDARGDIFSVGFTQGALHRENTSVVESFVEKRDGTDGDLEWGVQFAGSPATRAYSVAAAPNDGVFVVGTHDEQDPDGANTVRLFLRKIASETGDTLWEIEWGQTDAQTYPNSVRILGTNTLLIAGRGTGSPDADGATRLFALSVSQEDGAVIDSYWLGEGKHNLDAASATNASGEAFLAGELDQGASPDPLAPVQFVSSLGWGRFGSWRREFTPENFDYITSLSHSTLSPGWLAVAGSAQVREAGLPYAKSRFALELLNSQTGESVWRFEPGPGPESRARALSHRNNATWSIGGDTQGGLYGEHQGGSDIFVAQFHVDNAEVPPP